MNTSAASFSYVEIPLGHTTATPIIWHVYYLPEVDHIVVSVHPPEIQDYYRKKDPHKNWAEYVYLGEI